MWIPGDPEFPPRSFSFKVVDVDGTFIFPFSFLISWQSLTSWHGTLKNLRILNFFSSKTFSFDSFRKKWKANWVDWSSRVRIEIITFQLSISPIFYEHLLHMKMFQKAFLWLLSLIFFMVKGNWFNNCLYNVGDIDSRCQFHQHFTSIVFIQRSFTKLLCAYSF